MAKSYWELTNYPQPTTEKLQKNAEGTRKKAAKKGTELHPIVVKGRNIATSWWGAAWCRNLERYADFGSRIDRGKRYVRSGMVVDLQIQPGKISAKVQGSRRTPYKVEIRISPLSQENCQSIIDRCSEKIANLEALIDGSFPEEMKELFGGKGGLFPTPKEISFSCSCPDWALMCKHVAAALYGVGVRFDEDPLLFFQLRGIDVEHFIDISLANRVDQLLANVENGSQSSRIIADNSDLTALFGVL